MLKKIIRFILGHDICSSLAQDLYIETGEFNATVAVDFDGVLHQYKTPINFKEKHVIHDSPVKGACEWVQSLVNANIRVIVFTCRARSVEGLCAVKAWLDIHDFPPLEVTATKPVAKIYVDDRAWHFNGQELPTVKDIRLFRPWYSEKNHG